MDNEESSVNRVLVQFKEKDDNILIEHKLELSEDEYNEFMDNEEKMLKSAKRYKQNKEDRYLDFLIPAAIIIVSVAIADMMSGFRLHEWIADLVVGLRLGQYEIFIFDSRDSWNSSISVQP